MRKNCWFCWQKNTGKVKRTTKPAKPSELYKNYNRNDADLEQIEAVNQAAEECRKKGFLTYEMNGFSSEIMKIYLVDEKISEVEQYLAEHYQYEPKYVKRQYVERMIETYGGKSPVAGGGVRNLNGYWIGTGCPKIIFRRRRS